ncbi:MAG: TonB-dependent receptor plug domain-containing protein, partial [Prevotellaceae bacterium]|nr:TonB-dependent receptor plug domain-containing protein [Prevotellaceae bacterium]
MKRILLRLMAITVISFTAVLSLQAQNVVIKGTVYDANGKDPLPGATIQLKGTNKVVMATIDGTYAIEIAGENPVLVYQLLGYETQEIPVGSRAIIDVIMKESAVQLGEVVVTALGITREEKSLGYAVSKLRNEELTSSLSNNWMNAMSGKVAGLVFDSAGSGPGGSMRVTLRGDQSLNHSANGALFVVDGVPIASDGVSTSSGSNYANLDAPVDFGSGSNDINPEDVESVTVLKGPAATALYGSRAANGAIVITTKSGKKDKGVGVSISSSVVFERAGFWPDFQTEYGSGTNGGQTPFGFWASASGIGLDGIPINYHQDAYGERFDASKLRNQYDSKNWETGEYTDLPWIYQDDWYTGLFRTGVTYNNTVSIEGNNGNGTNSRFSFTDTRNDWILPNTGYKQQTVSLTFHTEVNKYINLNA